MFVCAFPQEISQVCNELPRLPSNCSVVKYIKETKSRVIGDISVKIFRIRKANIIAALQWLKKYHIGYRDIIILETNLNWMGDKTEMTLPIDAEITVNEEVEGMDDSGPSPNINVTPRELADVDIAYNGVVVDDSPVIASEEDEIIAATLESAGKNGDIVLNWPSIKEKAISELTDTKIFTLAFPWLFPGGVGDVKDVMKGHKATVAEWAKRLIMYEDARFSTDKIFCFYALNYMLRRRNRESGNFFVNKFSSGGDEDVESLRDAIMEGNSKFINEITYFSKEIPGTDSYWRFKRDQLHTWVNHHVERSNGMPSFFITLSCAEYYWPDIIRLVKERHFLATGETVDLSDGAAGRVQMINDHAAVVQEYFQKRVIDWLNTVGKQVFQIDHHWIRYEFAPSRGQIHAHMLCISRDQSMQQAMYTLRHKESAQAEVLSEWARRKIGMSAWHDPIEKTNTGLYPNPVSLRHCEVEDKELDLNALKGEIEIHKCSGYCLRDSKMEDKEAFCKRTGRTK